MILLKRELEIPKEAFSIELEMRKLLSSLIDLDISSPFKESFFKKYKEFLQMLDEFQKLTIKASQYECQCNVGCSHCCNHWVEDVNSFETIIVGDYIKKEFPERIPSIIEAFKNDDRHLQMVNGIMEQKISEAGEEEELSHLDQTDLLLASYYQLKRPCALLNEEGRCSVYDVRPLTCRIYFNFSKAEMCDPQKINDPDIPTYLVDVQEETNLLLDKLHLKFKRFNSTGLRSTLIEYLA